MNERLEAVYHIAPRVGVPTVYASVKYPKDKPPDIIEIGETRYVREDALERPVSVTLAVNT